MVEPVDAQTKLIPPQELYDLAPNQTFILFNYEVIKGSKLRPTPEEVN